MIRVANACVAAGIDAFGMIHDSYLCRAADAQRFREIVLREFATMYQQNDVLADLRKRAEEDIANNKMAKALFEKKGLKLPDVPAPEPRHDVDAIRHAEYAFA